jgi:patatin-like phospholipase/acyl hydrolase
MPSSQNYFNILSIDGGGLRGIIPAEILLALDVMLQAVDVNRGNKNFYQYFDLIAGSSTGALIALGLTTPDPASGQIRGPGDIANYYMTNGPNLFKRNFFKRFAPPLLDNVVPEATYDDGAIEKGLQDFYGGALITNCYTEVLVAAFDLTECRPQFFSRSLSPSAIRKGYVPADLQYPVRDVARCTSAEPTYFPPKVFYPMFKGVLSPTPHYYIGGGVTANDPAMCALVEALDRGFPLDMINLISVGTGSTTTNLGCPKSNVDWISSGGKNPIVEAFSAGNQETVAYQLALLNSAGYWALRLPGPAIPQDQSAMDDSSLLPTWKGLANNYVNDNDVLMDLEAVANQIK